MNRDLTPAIQRTFAHGFITSGRSSASLCEFHRPESKGEEFVSIYADAQMQCAHGQRLSKLERMSRGRGHVDENSANLPRT